MHDIVDYELVICNTQKDDFYILPYNEFENYGESWHFLCLCADSEKWTSM